MGSRGGCKIRQEEAIFGRIPLEEMLLRLECFAKERNLPVFHLIFD